MRIRIAIESEKLGSNLFKFGLCQAVEVWQNLEIARVDADAVPRKHFESIQSWQLLLLFLVIPHGDY